MIGYSRIESYNILLRKYKREAEESIKVLYEKKEAIKKAKDEYDKARMDYDFKSQRLSDHIENN